MNEIRIDYVALSEVERWPRNPKLHDINSLQKSVTRFGFIQPLVMDETSGKLVAGHGRLETLMTLKAEGGKPPERVKVSNGEWLVPVIRGVSFKDEAEAEAFLVADNRLSEIGGWDDAMLASILDDLRSKEDGLVGVGWDAQTVESFLRQVNPPTAEEMGALPDQRLATFQAGEIKQIVLYFDGASFDAVTERLQKTMTALNVHNHTEAFVALLEHYEATHSPKA